MPSLQEALQDTHPKVNTAAQATLTAVALVITQPEIMKNMESLIDALTKPDQKTNACLERLMETTFCNPMDTAALSVVIPVVTRGLRERSAELKKIAAMTAGNIFQLVQEARDMKPFVPVILPEVLKAVEHSHPDVRKAAERAKERLLSGAELTEGMQVEVKENPVVAAVCAQLAGRLPGAVAEFVAEEAALMLEEHAGLRELGEVLGPVVAGYLDEAAVAELCKDAQRVHKAHDLHAERHAGKDIIADIPNIILAFAGRVLMNKTSFWLERGHRYGLIGQNGVGKTTLLNRVAAGDINGWPKDLTVYYIQHEILAEAGTGVRDFMLSQVPKGYDTSRIKGVLTEVGFSEERQLAAVSELSGGWRMKLAIARSMMWEPQLLLLDEPTNHCACPRAPHCAKRFRRPLPGAAIAKLSARR